MKKKIAITAISALLLCAEMCAQIPLGISASANSASPYWDGADGVGVYSADSNCPLQVISENLTFNITGFPSTDYYDVNYTSSVCAEYEFRNPADGDITAHMLFPFGAEPDYYSEIEESSDLDSLYGVTTDGKDAGASLRYSFTEGNYSFDFADDSAYLHDTKQTFGNFNESTPVYKVTLNKVQTDYAAVIYTITSGNTIIIPESSSAEYTRRSTSSDNVTVQLTFDASNAAVFYVIGELPEIAAYELTRTYTSESGASYYVNDEPGGEVVSHVENSGTLGSFLQNYNIYPDGDYAEVDWFNFSMYFLITGSGHYFTDYCPYLGYVKSSYLNFYTMRWYSYDLTVKAGETVINAVTAPTYPTINTAYSPYIYEYSYLLSPAATWDSFENLTITISAPYYMLNSSVNFTMSGSVEDGTCVYTATFENLPSGELYFTLCEVEEPEYTSSSSGTAMIIFIVLVIIFIYIIPAVGILTGIIIGIVFLVKRHKKKKEK